MFKVNNKDTRMTPMANGIVLVSLLLTLNIFHTLFYCFVVNFEKVIAAWVSDPYVLTRCCAYMGKYGSEKTPILTYFTQRFFRKKFFLAPLFNVSKDVMNAPLEVFKTFLCHGKTTWYANISTLYMMLETKTRRVKLQHYIERISLYF